MNGVQIMYFVYVLKSISNGKLYIGHTNDLEKRLSLHNKGVTRSTRHCRDWGLIHKEEFYTRSLAIKREKYLKSGDGRKVLNLKGIA